MKSSLGNARAKYKISHTDIIASDHMVKVHSPRSGKRSRKVMIPDNLIVKNRVNLISHTKYVLDADIKECFDNISHE
jgi:hypothetical protein